MCDHYAEGTELHAKSGKRKTKERKIFKKQNKNNSPCNIQTEQVEVVYAYHSSTLEGGDKIGSSRSRLTILFFK